MSAMLVFKSIKSTSSQHHIDVSLLDSQKNIEHARGKLNLNKLRENHKSQQLIKHPSVLHALYTNSLIDNT